MSEDRRSVLAPFINVCRRTLLMRGTERDRGKLQKHYKRIVDALPPEADHGSPETLALVVRELQAALKDRMACLSAIQTCHEALTALLPEFPRHNSVVFGSRLRDHVNKVIEGPRYVPTPYVTEHGVDAVGEFQSICHGNLDGMSDCSGPWRLWYKGFRTACSETLPGTELDISSPETLALIMRKLREILKDHPECLADVEKCYAKTLSRLK